MQQQNIKELTNNLARQKQLYIDLLELSKKETEYLNAGDIEGLSNVLAVIETIIKTLGEVEASRQKIINGSLVGQQGEEAKLSGIINKYPEEAEELRKFQSELIELIEEISKTENKNAALIKKALSDIDYMKNLFVEDTSGIYTKKGKNGNSNFLLDHKI